MSWPVAGRRGGTSDDFKMDWAVSCAEWAEVAQHGVVLHIYEVAGWLWVLWAAVVAAVLVCASVCDQSSEGDWALGQFDLSASVVFHEIWTAWVWVVKERNQVVTLHVTEGLVVDGFEVTWVLASRVVITLVFGSLWIVIWVVWATSWIGLIVSKACGSCNTVLRGIGLDSLNRIGLNESLFRLCEGDQ